MADTTLDTLNAYLAHAAEASDGSTGLRFLDRRERDTFFDWSTVYARARAAAGALAQAGVKPGDRVALLLPTCPAFTDAYFGAQLLGAVPVGLYPPVRLGRLDEYFDKTAAMLRVLKATLIVTDSRVGRVLGQLAERYQAPLGQLDANTLAEGPDRDPHPVAGDDLAMVQFSSGTTVAPKPVGLTHQQCLANASRIMDYVIRAAPEGVKPSGCSWLPLYHDMGLIGCIMPAVMRAETLTLIPPEVFLAKPGIWLRALSKYGATVSPAPNFAYALCTERLRDDELEGLDLSQWTMAMNGAEPIAPATIRAFEDRFGPVGFRAEAMMPVYGLSEATLAVTFSDPLTRWRSTRFDAQALGRGDAVPSDDGVELVSVGTALPDFEVEIRDADRNALPDGRIGTLWTRGPSIMKGYLDREEQPFVDGWLDTGDLAFVHEGEVYISGRRKDLIVHRGRNHAPQDLERAVDSVEGVRTGCAVAVAHVGEDGEQILMFVEVREPRDDMADACLRAVKGATGLEPSLMALVEPGTLPRTSSGKLRRSETLSRWLDGSLVPPKKVTPWFLAGTLAKSARGYLRARWSRDD